MGTKILLYLMLLIFLGVGCTTNDLSSKSTPQPVVLDTIASPIQISTSTRQSNSSPTQSLQFTPTVKRFTTVMQNVTPIRPTLTKKQQEEKIRINLNSEGSCLLPCWWGIEPGKTNWKEAYERLKEMGLKASPSGSYYQAVFHQFGQGEENIQQWIKLRLKKQEIDMVDIIVTPSSNHQTFQSLWGNYSPEKVLERYGKPSRVWLQSSQYGKDRVGYSLWLFFDERKALFIFGGDIENENLYHICPSFMSGQKNINLEMIGTAKNSFQDLENFTEQYNDYAKPLIKDLKEATGLSIDEFYSLSQKGPSSFCFDTPHNIWP